MQEPKDLIKQKLDIAEVIGEYITLKPAGSGSLKGLCPFHGERTPSFHVSRERQMWHCFGCSKGGDMFAFVMEMDSLSFPEALRHLAAKAGVDLPEYKPTQVTGIKERMISMHDLAGKFYTKLLLDHAEGASVKTYVEKRRIPTELVEKFRLGASPNRWDALVKFLASKGFTEKEMLDGGLALKRKSGNGIFDRFRNRLMIPLSDITGNIVGFTARQLPGDTFEAAKYVNSPETPIYHKGDMLYGLHLAKNGIRARKEIIVVEGNLDVIASHKAGVENIVASSGTALTAAQLKTLSRYTKRIVFALDEDAAGFNAVKRVFDLALSLRTEDSAMAFDIRCLIIPPNAGKDADEIVQKDPELWRSISESSQDIVEFFFTKQLRDFEAGGGVARIDLRTKLIDELMPHVARLSRPDERHLYLLRISDATHVDVELLSEMMRARLAKAPLMAPAKAAPAVKPQQSGSSGDKTLIAAEFLMALAIKHAAFAKEALDVVPVDMLPEGYLKKLYNGLIAVYTDGQTPTDGAPQKNSQYSRLRAWLEREGTGGETSLLDALVLRTDELLAGLSPKEVRAEADRNITIFSESLAKRRRKLLEASIREAELAGDTERLERLLREYSAFIARNP